MLDPDQAQIDVGPHLDPNCWHTNGGDQEWQLVFLYTTKTILASCWLTLLLCRLLIAFASRMDPDQSRYWTDLDPESLFDTLKSFLKKMT